MKRSAALASAFVSLLALNACDRPTTVVTNPPPGSVATPAPEPAPAPVVVQQVPVPVPVPGPPGPQGDPGKPGDPGKTGAPGDTTVVVVPPAASEEPK